MAAAVAAAVRRRDEQRGDRNDDGGDVVKSPTKTSVAPEDLLPPWRGKRMAVVGGGIYHEP